MLVQKIRNLIEQTIKDNNYILDEILYLNEDGTNFLRVIIDKQGIIDVDDCVCVTKLINPILDDNEDLFEEAYILDVCSKEKGCE